MKKNLIVRQAIQADYATIYNLIKTAFETAEHSDGSEQDFAVDLRNGENYIPGLDLVAELDGQVAGHIMLTKTFVAEPAGGRYDTLMVAPLSVLKEYRGAGVGTALMNEGLRRAGAMGYGAAFLLGDPGYYRRFGFEPSRFYGIRHDSFPAEYVLAKEVVPGALDGVEGVIDM